MRTERGPKRVEKADAHLEIRSKQTLADDKKKGDKPWFSLPDFTGGKGGVF